MIPIINGDVNLFKNKPNLNQALLRLVSIFGTINARSKNKIPRKNSQVAKFWDSFIRKYIAKIMQNADITRPNCLFDE